MDFFEHQELARRTTRKLIVLFAIAVIAVVIAVNLAAAAIYLGFMLPHGVVRGVAALPNGFFLTNTVVVLGLIFGGTVLEMTSLRAGGAAPADPIAQLRNRRHHSERALRDAAHSKLCSGPG